MPSDKHLPRIPEEDRNAVEAAIAEAEKRTSAEIVVVVAARSGRYDRAEDAVGLVLGLAAVAAAWMLWQGIRPDTAAWSTGYTVAVGLAPVLLLFAVWAILGAALATRFPALARPFISRRRMDSEVRRRGAEAFHMFRVDRTAGATGVLIFVSLFERMVYIAGHDGIEAKLGAAAWNPVRDGLIKCIREGTPPGRALAAAVAQCAGILAPAFPAEPGDKDELPNTVHLLA